MHPLIDRYFFAYAALFFAFVFFAVLAIYGGHYTQSAVALAAWCGVVSQFMAQNPQTPIAHGLASGLGLVAALFALILFTLGY